MKFVTTIFVFCTMMTFGQDVQKVAVGAIMDYSVAVQHPVIESSYTFFWSIKGKEEQKANDGLFGRYKIDYSKKDYKAGNTYTLSVYMQRDSKENIEICPSNTQDLAIEIIDKPEISITGEGNVGVCSYAEVNAHTAIYFKLNIVGYKGQCRIAYDIIDNDGAVVLSHKGLDYNSEDNLGIHVNENADDIFINNSKDKVDFIFKIKDIEFIEGDVSNNYDYTQLTGTIEVLPAVDLGKINF